MAKHGMKRLVAAAALMLAPAAQVFAATTVRVCPGVQTLNSSSEIFLTSSISGNSSSVSSIAIYNAAGSQLKNYTTTFPGSVTGSQPLNATQSFTLSSIFGTTNIGAVAVVITYSVSGQVIPANYPTAYFTQTFTDSSGNIAAKFGDYCVVQPSA